jgi:hypothetical protein
MVRIAITIEAFDAIASTLKLGTIAFELAFEQELNANGQIYVRVTPSAADRLTAMRGPGESYSDLILRIAGAEALATRRG